MSISILYRNEEVYENDTQIKTTSRDKNTMTKNAIYREDGKKKFTRTHIPFFLDTTFFFKRTLFSFTLMEKHNSI